ncbi:MAG: DUF370 domain-containing protein [Deltaproteobacteria bacterium]|nr:DUF370 domain-containing protein [Deltaproteobacteria bacterium]
MDIGQGASLAASQVLAILKANTSSSRKLKGVAKDLNVLIDATGGKPARSLVVTLSNHLILSAQDPEELTQRLNEIYRLPEN